VEGSAVEGVLGECRMLEPGKDKCKQHARNKGKIVERWLPFGHIIDEVLEELGAF
jgi:hypothetical protein